MKALAIVGATASGKTALSLTVARRFGCEIICCDSMQIYKYMDIGTAKATDAERSEAPHHLLDFLDPCTPYSAADYARDAKMAATDIISRGNIPLFCGGTGLYLEAARTGRHADSPASDERYRKELQWIAATEEGKDTLYRMLCEYDPESAEATHKNNIKRVIRALEIYHASGIPKSEWDRRSRAVPPEMDILTFCVTYRDRELLYRRIDERVDKMLENGLADETRFLMERGYLHPDTTAGQAIGYKEYACFLRGEISEDEAIENIKLATRHYAKRQMTWFSSKDYIRKIYMDRDTRIATPAEICEEIASEVTNFLNKA